MAQLKSADRYLLGDAGLEVDERTYVEAIAGMGFGHFSDSAVSVLAYGPFHAQRERPVRRSELLEFQRRWHTLKGDSQDPPRLTIFDHVSRAGFDPLALARVLSHPDLKAESVFVIPTDMRSDARWQWPMRIGAWSDDLQQLRLEGLRGSDRWPANTLTEIHEVTRDHARNEILIVRGTVRSALQRVLASPFPMRAAHVMLLGATDLEWQTISNPLKTLLDELQAGGASLIAPKTSDLLYGLNQLIWHLSHNRPFDVALHNAFASPAAAHILSFELIHATALPTAMRKLGRRFDALPPTASVALPRATRGRIDLEWASGQTPGDLGRELTRRAATFPYNRESEGGTAATELAMAEGDARRDAAATESPRTLQADLYSIGEDGQQQHSRPLLVGANYRIDVFIAPGEEGSLVADRQFPDEKLDWQASDEFTLTVLFAEANQWPDVQRGELKLPRYGPSQRCPFVFTPTKPGAFSARLTIMYRGRVLQTALLQTIVCDDRASTLEGPAPQLVIEARLRESLTTLDDRQRFDAAIVCNHTANGQPTMQAGGEAGAYIASLDKVEVVLAEISKRLHEAALEARRYSKGLKTADAAALLVDLATHGNSLYRNLVIDYVDESPAAEALRKSDYLQIVAAKPDAIVPFELVYEYPPPADGVKVCPNAAEALRNGKCPATCKPKSSPAPHVCPMGFWGLQKVIERHVHDATLATEARVTGIEPIVGRNTLVLNGAGIVAASEKVLAAEQRKLTSALKRGWKSGPISIVKKWAKWPDVIDKTKPALILALPHSTGAGNRIGLEISGDILQSRYIIDTYIRANPDRKPPLVVLLGCDMAAAYDPKAYASHVAYFRQASAPVILGTLASVEPSDSANCATTLVKHLVLVVDSNPGRFGTVLLQTKREAVASGLIMALGLVGFGDADWQIKA